MGHDWILDVLADLRRFAQLNDLPLLAVQLDETAIVANAELSILKEGAPVTVRGDAAETGQIFHQAGVSRRS